VGGGGFWHLGAAPFFPPTSGLGYSHLVGKLTEYPIPEIRLPPGEGRSLLDIGCSWGRWCVAAGRRGYVPVGLDPSLGGVMAARRVCAQLGIQARFIVGDARHLPLRSSLFDQVFSYSVIQHFSPADAAQTIGHAGRVLKAGGNSLIQMPTKLGLRCLYNQLRRGFREPTGFDVRYWSLGELRRLFESRIGRTQFSVDCFFGIGWQASDAHLMPPVFRAVIATSEFLRRLAARFPPLTRIADSVYVESRKEDTGSPRPA
jgi:SAM-dependent methyltransferase